MRGRRRPSRVEVVRQATSPTNTPRPPADVPSNDIPPTERNNNMKRFMIEREIPGANKLTEADLAQISKTSNAVVESLGVPYNWVNSYVAGDKVYCVHETDDVETILEHARRGEFPADTVSVVVNEFGPQTAALAES
jgi:hypothetical protein